LARLVVDELFLLDYEWPPMAMQAMNQAFTNLQVPAPDGPPPPNCDTVDLLRFRALLIYCIDCSLEASVFEWDGQFYRQSSGAPMGFALIPLLSHVFLHRWWRLIQETAGEELISRLHGFGVYFDDTTSAFVGTRAQLDQFLEIADTVLPEIRITSVVSQVSVVAMDCELFLDRQEPAVGCEGPRFLRVATRYYMKPCQPVSCIPPNSAHGPHVPRRAIAQEVLRRLMRCTYAIDAEDPIAALHAAGMEQGHSRGFMNRAVADGRSLHVQILIRVANGERPLWRSRVFRLQQRGHIRKPLAKPGAATIWTTAERDLTTSKLLKRWINELGLRAWLQVGHRRGPTLLDLCTRSSLRRPPPHNHPTCLVCAGAQLHIDLPPELQFCRPLECYTRNVTYMAICTLCPTPCFYVGETGGPGFARCGSDHRTDIRSAVYQHQHDVHGGITCWKFYCLQRSSGNSTHRRLCESMATRELAHSLQGRLLCLNDMSRLVRLFPPLEGLALPEQDDPPPYPDDPEWQP